MVAIKALWPGSIKAAIFLDLSCHNVLEGGHEPRIKYDLGERVPQQAPG
jgi:hypothetical protein